MNITKVMCAIFVYLCIANSGKTLNKASMGKKEEEEQDPRESLRNFVIESKVRAFLARYRPMEAGKDADPDRIFGEQSLRKFFGAYTKTVGDPLAIYVDEYLEPAGFRMEVDEFGDEPVIKVMEKT